MIEALIVDDAALNLKLLSVLLSSHGYRVRTADTAEHALEILETYLPQLLIVDIRLPGMDGLTMVRMLRAQPRYRDVVVVAVTASAMKGDEDVALAAGCDSYITKPIDTRTLPTHLAHCMSRRRTP
jgi:two-component system, cell cycle response regulator DivK